MNTAKDHYDQQLASVYSWMSGNPEAALKRNHGSNAILWGGLRSQPSSHIYRIFGRAKNLEDGLVSDFARDWQVDGRDVVEQVQESVMKDVLDYCRGFQMDDAYRAFRQAVITKPTLPYTEYRRMLSAPIFHPLREYLRQTYVEGL